MSLSGRLEAVLLGGTSDGRAVSVVAGVGTIGGCVLPAAGCRPAHPASAKAAQQQKIKIVSRLFAAAGVRFTFSLIYAEVSLLFSVSRAERRASSHPAASVNFSETSRKNCAVRSSVLGAKSSSTNRRSRVSSSSSLRPTSSNLSTFNLLSRAFRRDWRNSGIIGTRKTARKEAHWQFPFNGNGASTE